MIVLDRIELRRGARVLLSEASVTLHPGEKIGLVGRNGAGKSSLFSLLAGRLHEERGELLNYVASGIVGDGLTKDFEDIKFQEANTAWMAYFSCSCGSVGKSRPISFLTSFL